MINDQLSTHLHNLAQVKVYFLHKDLHLVVEASKSCPAPRILIWEGTDHDQDFQKLSVVVVVAVVAVVVVAAVAAVGEDNLNRKIIVRKCFAS